MNETGLDSYTTLSNLENITLHSVSHKQTVSIYRIVATIALGQPDRGKAAMHWCHQQARWVKCLAQKHNKAVTRTGNPPLRTSIPDVFKLVISRLQLLGWFSTPGCSWSVQERAAPKLTPPSTKMSSKEMIQQQGLTLETKELETCIVAIGTSGHCWLFQLNELSRGSIISRNPSM